MTISRAASLLLLIFLSPSLPADPSSARPIRVLLLSGMNNHAWKSTTPALVAGLEKGGLCSVTVLEKTHTLNEDLLGKHDVVLSNFNTFVSRRAPEKNPGWTGETRQALERAPRGPRSPHDREESPSRRCAAMCPARPAEERGSPLRAVAPRPRAHTPGGSL